MSVLNVAGMAATVTGAWLTDYFHVTETDFSGPLSTYVCMYVCMYVYIYIYVYTCVYIYIYIYIERERDI